MPSCTSRLVSQKMMEKMVKKLLGQHQNSMFIPLIASIIICPTLSQLIIGITKKSAATMRSCISLLVSQKMMEKMVKKLLGQHQNRIAIPLIASIIICPTLSQQIIGITKKSAVTMRSCISRLVSQKMMEKMVKKLLGQHLNSMFIPLIASIIICPTLSQRIIRITKKSAATMRSCISLLVSQKMMEKMMKKMLGQHLNHVFNVLKIRLEIFSKLSHRFLNPFCVAFAQKIDFKNIVLMLNNCYFRKLIKTLPVMRTFRLFIIWSIFLTAFTTGISAEHLILLTTNDVHSQFDPNDDGTGGVLRRRVVIDSVRKAEKNVLLIDAGDDVQGALYFNLFGGKLEYALLDSLKYDMHIVGNHEFDNGMDSLAYFYRNVKCPLLATNYDYSATPLAGLSTPYIIKNFNGKRIAFMGINIEPKGLIFKTNYKGLGFIDPLKVADATAKYLKEVQRVDFVVMVSHIGYATNPNTTPSDTDVVRSSHFIDLVVGAHTHTDVDPAVANSKYPWQIKNADGKIIPVTQAGSHGTYVGYIDVNLDNLKVDNYRLIRIDKRYDDRVAAYPAMAEWIKGYRDEIQSRLSVVIAVSAKQMSSWVMGALNNWASDVAEDIAHQLSGLKIDCAIMNKGGVRHNMPKGDVTEGIIRSMFPFSNHLVVIKLSGKDLLASIDIMASRHGDAVSKEIMVDFNSSGKVVKATINGKKIDPNRIYTVATIDFLAAGGDYMVPLTHGEEVYAGGKLNDLIVDYVKGLTAKGKMIDSPDVARMREVK
jgi:5'-nucleotidase / UDP-sugar diphosphatase